MIEKRTHRKRLLHIQYTHTLRLLLDIACLILTQSFPVYYEMWKMKVVKHNYSGLESKFLIHELDCLPNIILIQVCMLGQFLHLFCKLIQLHVQEVDEHRPKAETHVYLLVMESSLQQSAFHCLYNLGISASKHPFALCGFNDHSVSFRMVRVIDTYILNYTCLLTFTF